jgi:GAF domain-containing protein
MGDRIERVLEARNRVLERIAQGAPIEEVFEILTTTSEQLFPGMLCSILVLDGTGHLHHGAAPSLNPAYTAAVDGLAIGPNQGSCGTAAYLGERVIVEDVLEHPYWATGHELARLADIRACWSEPIRSAKGAVLGTFAMYYRMPRAPEAFELDFMKRSAHIAGIAIERRRAESELENYREHLEELVVQRTEEVRVLRGMLPLCAWCKRIRDDDGSWTDLGSYLSHHSGATVTHGICPECSVGLRDRPTP